jgi:hypothetical protein
MYGKDCLKNRSFFHLMNPQICTKISAQKYKKRNLNDSELILFSSFFQINQKQK